ncbi:conserved hypothetical protein [Ricinus communis]|uniref:RNase H type-1 domain-containing protein n=1 Tax=Ricinus communis TaxID=3988 RepID=B9SNI8_RICCO|nr:conserved hypothetical protein [Ricinus communis]
MMDFQECYRVAHGCLQEFDAAHSLPLALLVLLVTVLGILLLILFGRAVLRNPSGGIIAAASKFLHHCFSIYCAEALACKEGIAFAATHGAKNLIVEMDCHKLHSSLSLKVDDLSYFGPSWWISKMLCKLLVLCPLAGFVEKPIVRLMV